MAPWLILIVGILMLWIALKNKATDVVNALLGGARIGGNSASSGGVSAGGSF